MTDASPSVMEGFMMKKKHAAGSSRALLRSLGLKWVMRYFILYEDGKLVYYKDRPSKDGDATDPGEVLCNNIGACTINRVTAADLAGSEDKVANSFHILVPQGGSTRRMGAETKTLLVCNGPKEFKDWVLTFRKFETSVNVGTDIAAEGPLGGPLGAVKEAEEVKEEKAGDVPREISTSAPEVEQAPEKIIVAPAVQQKEAAKETEDIDKKEDIPAAAPKPDFGFLEEEVKAEEANVPKPPQPEDPPVEEEVVIEPENSPKEDVDDPAEPEVSTAIEWGVPPRDSPEPEAEAPETPKSPAVAPDTPMESDVDIEGVVKLLEEERRQELRLLMKDKSLKKDARKAAMDEVKAKYDMLIEDAKDGKFLSPMDAKAAAAAAAMPVPTLEEEEEPVAEETPPEISHDATKAAVEAIETEKEEVVVEKAKPGKNTDKLAAAESAIKALNDAPQKEVAEEEEQEIEKPKHEGDMNVKVFAYGDTFDEMHTKLSGDDYENRSLVAILVTSLEEMRAGHKEGDKNGAFLIDLAGNNKVHHLLEIERMFCQNDTSLFSKTHSIFYDDEEGTKDQIVNILEASRGEDKKTPKKPPKEIPAMFSPGSVEAMTAFKQAEPTPTGEEVLGVVREALGTPYNWVLFKPSKKELLIEDAGSGGVMEMTKLLEGSYNDRVLFGLMRISFVSDKFGRRQFWAGLEWKGDECRSVRMKMQLSNCLDPMKKLIGDRSFTLANLSASEMTPEMVVDRVRRSVNVQDFDASVEALKKGHDEEQKAIKAYWDKVKKGRTEEEEKAKRAAEEEEEMRRKFDGDAKGLRRWKWSRMSPTELLTDMGKDNLPGWVLLEVDVPMIS